MDDPMAIETGAAAGAAAKFGVLAKVGAMFGASAVGAAFIAAYHPETRRETWWRSLGAGVGGVFVGGAVLRIAAHYVPSIAPPAGGGEALFDWVATVVLPSMFVFGGLFWGLVGALQNLAKKINDKGADVVAEKVGL